MGIITIFAVKNENVDGVLQYINLLKSQNEWLGYELKEGPTETEIYVMDLDD